MRLGVSGRIAPPCVLNCSTIRMLLVTEPPFLFPFCTFPSSLSLVYNRLSHTGEGKEVLTLVNTRTRVVTAQHQLFFCVSSSKPSPGVSYRCSSLASSLLNPPGYPPPCQAYTCILPGPLPRSPGLFSAFNKVSLALTPPAS
ncbi:putative protein kinase [Leishmania braziliensis MHOM/BR/75/M2904]|uniref:Uncharacterized protein n=1 Tax=Leishmania braziliensis TaxID=5660 RepID=E9AIW1_LEIBR|nr:putative protein kinase [Leishmania braziliensis MHOM/BR/75/M2904]CBZ14830.1 putative protein kinase [Leishmania braziliensis MHOM/BR/75/M2904]